MKLHFNRICTKISGAEIYNLYLLDELKKFKRLKISFSSDNTKLISLIRKKNIPAYYINSVVKEVGTKRQFLKAILALPIYYYQYLSFFKNINCDIYILESMTEKIFLTLVLKIWKKKTIWIEHGPLFNTRRASIIKKLYSLNTIIVDKIVCVSQDTADDLKSHVLDPGKIEFLHIGINVELFTPYKNSFILEIKNKLGLQKGALIGFFGTVNKEKGIETFINVARLISIEKSNIFFLIIGDGNLLDWAKDIVKKLKISNRFYFTGRVENVKEYVGILDLLFFPSSHAEGLSIALLETISMGVPCVASDVGGNREVIRDGVSGMIYKDSSLQMIKETIYKVLNENKKYKAKSRKFAEEKFSINRNIKNFYQVFREIYEN